VQAQITTAAMIDDVITWIKKQDFYTRNQQPNYAVAITGGGRMIISKVGGVTSKTSGMGDLAGYIQSKDWWTELEGLYFGKTFGGDGGSNHGEMCVLAAADAMGEKIAEMKCTGDNCPACFEMLKHAGVKTLNKSATGSQSGWIHPRGRMALGSQLNSDWKGQIEELKAFNKLSAAAQEDFDYTLTRATGYDPAGSYEEYV